MQTTRSHDTRLRLLTAAAEVLADEGYAATSLSTVAARIGLTKGAFAYHFPTKGTISEALRDEFLATVDGIEARSREVFPDKPAQAFLLYLAGIGSTLVSDPVFRGASALSFDLSAPRRDAVDMLTRTLWHLERFIADFDTAGTARADRTPADLAEVVLWMLMGQNFTGRRLVRTAANPDLTSRVLLELTHVENPDAAIEEVSALLRSGEMEYRVITFQAGELAPEKPLDAG
ncbi:ScbR family autoregulator-binding transcription factor [Rarobacter faecitabidus]|uniref:TetR/AcrR family transcriptional regulator n=1 Tax=Rarobacter faecitabidus TaxID=13243 RepID=UPI0014768840|nr:TetR/AcrR family transcriptional regulator [Rarobacter faecitabidus]